MTTVMAMLNVSDADTESEDGLNHQQRKVLYRLIVAGEASASPTHDHDYTITKALGFHPAVCGEIGESLKYLVEAGFVQKLLGTEPSSAYGKTQVVTLSKVTYWPVLNSSTGLFIPKDALRRPVLAWLYLYGSLEYDENRAPDNETCHKSLIAQAMGEPESATDAARADVEQISKLGLAAAHLEKRPTQWRGGHGQMHDIMATHVTVELIS